MHPPAGMPYPNALGYGTCQVDSMGFEISSRQILGRGFTGGTEDRLDDIQCSEADRDRPLDGKVASGESDTRHLMFLL